MTLATATRVVKKKDQILMNHQSTQKLKRSVKAQQENGYDRTLDMFTRIAKEFEHEKNFSEYRTVHSGKEGTRNFIIKQMYGYSPLEPGY